MIIFFHFFLFGPKIIQVLFKISNNFSDKNFTTWNSFFCCTFLNWLSNNLVIRNHMLELEKRRDPSCKFDDVTYNPWIYMGWRHTWSPWLRKWHVIWRWYSVSESKWRTEYVFHSTVLVFYYLINLMEEGSICFYFFYSITLLLIFSSFPSLHLFSIFFIDPSLLLFLTNSFHVPTVPFLINKIIYI